MRKKILGILLTIIFLASPASADTESLAGKTVALDAGHGGDETGAINTTHNVFEKDVNLDVVYSLKEKLKAQGAIVVLTRDGDETLPSRRDRVELANAECIILTGSKCDILVSVHHNGSLDTSHDGTLTIYNEKRDIPLAEAIHDTLIDGLKLNDEGYLHGGYGMTVYDKTVSTITEAYYITNDDEAYQYLYNQDNHIEKEAQAIFDGIINYFQLNIERPGKS